MAYEKKALNAAGIRKIQDILSESGGLAAHCVGAFHVSGAEAAEMRDEKAEVLVPEIFDYSIPGTEAVRKSVEEDSRLAVGRTVLLVFDVDESCFRDGH